MARDDSKAWLNLQLSLVALLEPTRPSDAFGWASPAGLIVTQAVVGAGHWAAGRRQRALAAWLSVAGHGLVAWGLAAEAPTSAEMIEETQPIRDRLLELGARLGPAARNTAATLPHPSQRSAHIISAAGAVTQTVQGIRSGLRRPQRLTGRAIAGEAPSAVIYVLRTARAVQRRRPRIAVGSAVLVAASAARLRAVAAEPIG